MTLPGHVPTREVAREKNGRKAFCFARRQQRPEGASAPSDEEGAYYLAILVGRGRDRWPNRREVERARVADRLPSGPDRGDLGQGPPGEGIGKDCRLTVQGTNRIKDQVTLAESSHLG